MVESNHAQTKAFVEENFNIISTRNSPAAIGGLTQMKIHSRKVALSHVRNEAARPLMTEFSESEIGILENSYTYSKTLVENHLSLISTRNNPTCPGGESQLNTSRDLSGRAQALHDNGQRQQGLEREANLQCSRVLQLEYRMIEAHDSVAVGITDG